jgi:hypothetical protein
MTLRISILMPVWNGEKFPAAKRLTLVLIPGGSTIKAPMERLVANNK